MEKSIKIGRVEIDREACISVASCVEIAPESFELDEDGKARIINKDGDVALILEAAKSCPVDAIRVFDEAGGQIWPPLQK